MKGNIVLALLVFYPFLGGILTWLAGNRKERGDNCRDYLADGIVISEFLLMAVLFFLFGKTAGAGSVMECRLPGVCGLGLSFTLDGFRLIYGTVACFMWMMTTILSRQYFTHHENRNRFYLFLLLTLGATMGVFLSGDLYTTFIFFEIMSFTSYVWVAQEESKEALKAAGTYLAVAVIGGLVMLMGLFTLFHQLGTLQMDELLAAAQSYVTAKGADGAQRQGILYAAGVCLLFGFGAKAGAFPLHIWLPKAHPVAPAPASALLSGILTKTGIFGILVTTSTIFLHETPWGILVLIVGVITMTGGALLAVFSVDLKRTLACSSMSQIGFILVGVGMQCLLGEENALAVHGTLLHMVNHSLIKLVLFMAAGVIFMNAHALNLNEIRGYGRKKPLLKAIFLTGALAIAGIPGFGGYVSKTLLHESILEYSRGILIRLVEWLFLISGGLTVAYMTKLYVAVFVERNDSAEVQRKFDKQKDYMNRESAFALAGSALVLFFWGLVPTLTMNKAAGLGQGLMGLAEFGEPVAYFSLKNLSGAVISLVIGAAVYLLVIRGMLMKKQAKGAMVYVNAWPAWLDLENLLYRPLLLQILPGVAGVFCRILDSTADLAVVVLRKTVYRDSPLPHERVEGNWFTEAAGRVMNFIQAIGNRTWNRRHPGTRDYVHILAVRNEELRENNTIIGRSLSFGLLLFCIGMCLTLIYIIVL